MKICTNCGAVNKDENNFCNGCGQTSFTEQHDLPPVQPTCAPMPPMPILPPKKPEFTKYDLFTIFSFVASIVGTFVIALILEPLALAAAILGFARGKRYRGLAIAAVVIAVIGLLIRLFITLYEQDLVPEWLILGALGD